MSMDPGRHRSRPRQPPDSRHQHQGGRGHPSGRGEYLAENSEEK